MSIEILLQEERTLNLSKTTLTKKLRKSRLTRSAKNYLYERLTTIDNKLALIKKHRQENQLPHLVTTNID
jgi:hypothetical protein